MSAFTVYDWWQLVLILLALSVVVVAISLSVVTMIKAATGRSLSIGRGGLQVTQSVAKAENPMKRLVEERRWAEVVLRVDKAIRIAFRKSEIIFNDLPRDQYVEVDRAIGDMRRLIESGYLTTCESCIDEPVPVHRDYREFRLLLSDALREITESIKLRIKENHLGNIEPAEYNQVISRMQEHVFGELMRFVDTEYADYMLTPRSSVRTTLLDLRGSVDELITRTMWRVRTVTIKYADELAKIEDELEQHTRM